MTLEQVIIISQVKFASEFWKKIFQAQSIQTLIVDDFTSFAHFIDDLNPELVMVDLKLAQLPTFDENFLREIKKAKADYSLLFLGTKEEWEENQKYHQLGNHLETPIALATAVETIKTLL